MIKRKKNSGKTSGLFSKNGRASSRKKSASTYTLELLESRVLLSGDLAGAVQAMQIKPVQVPAQAVVLNLAAAPAASQQTVSVADMLTKPASSLNQYAGESSRANSHEANHAADAVVSKGAGEARQQSWINKNHGKSQFLAPTVQSQPSTPQDSANVVNAISPSLQSASIPQAQNQQTPMTITAMQSDMATMPPIVQSQPIPQPIVTTSPTVVDAPVSQAPTIPTSQMVAQPVSSTPQSSQTISQALVTPVQTTPTVVDPPVSQVPTIPTSQMVAQPVSSTPQPSQTISQALVTPVQTVSSTLAPVQTVTSSPNLTQSTVSTIQTVQQPTQTVSQPVSTTTVAPIVPITTPTTTSTITSDAINPTLPQATVDTSMPTTSVTVRVGPHGDYTDLQTALNNVSLGTTILLEPGISYTTTNDSGFILPNKTTGTGWIVIRPDVPDSALPAPGTRVTSADSAWMPKIVRANANLYGMSVAPGAHNYRIIGVEFMNQGNADTPYNGAFVNLDGREGSVSAQSNHIVLDRAYIHGPSATGSVGVKFGVVLGGQYQAVIDSTIESLHSSDGEAKAIAGWDGAGPWLINNNLLSASGENIMIGGATPFISGLTPSDITITHNDFYKPLAWRDDPAYTSGPNPVVTKNLFELKNAQRVLVDANTFENVWPDGQSGYAMVLTPRGGGATGSDPWTTVADVTISNNLFKNCADGIGISGGGATISLAQGGPTQHGGRFLVENNLFVNLGGDYGVGTTSGNFAIIGLGATDVQFKHNTVASYAGSTMRGVLFTFPYGISGEGGLFPLQRFVVQDNIFVARAYVLSLGEAGSLSTVAPNYIWTNNVVSGPWPTSGGWTAAMLPQGNGNAYPVGEANVGYVNPTSGDYRLASISPYKGAASDGTDIGINWNQFNAANS